MDKEVNCNKRDITINSLDTFNLSPQHNMEEKNEKRKNYSIDKAPINVKSPEMINKANTFDQIKIKNNDIQKRKSAIPRISKDTKSKFSVTLSNSCTYPTKHHPFSKKKVVPVLSQLKNSSANIVLFERNVEIKNLESSIKYLQNKIKELESENRTLRDVQSRHEKELRKFKQGVADIPSLLRSHREDIKVLESTICSLRRDLKDCQKDLKSKNEIILKKDNIKEKLNASIKQNEKNIHDLSHQVKELKTVKTKLEEENRKLAGDNGSLKCENEDLQSKIKELVLRILNLEDLAKGNNILEKEMEQSEIKYENSSQKVTDEHSTVYPDDISDVSSSSKVSLKCIVPNISKVSVQSEEKILEPFPIGCNLEDQSHVKISEKIEETLISSVKSYQDQDVCWNEIWKGANITSSEFPNDNSKLLPPLKVCKKSSQDIDFTLENKEKCTSVADANFILNQKTLLCKREDVLDKFCCKFNMNNSETEVLKKSQISAMEGIFNNRNERKFNKYVSNINFKPKENLACRNKELSKDIFTQMYCKSRENILENSRLSTSNELKNKVKYIREDKHFYI